MSEVQDYTRQGPRLPPLLARNKALPDLFPAAESNTGHATVVTSSPVTAAAAVAPKEDSVGPPAPPLVVRGGTGSSAGALSPTSVPGAPPTFPPVPTLVGNKYLLTRPFDHSACHATHIHTGQSLLVKSLEGRVAHELVAHHALMAGCEGVRSPLEMVVSGCRRRRGWSSPPITETSTLTCGCGGGCGRPRHRGSSLRWPLLWPRVIRLDLFSGTSNYASLSSPTQTGYSSFPLIGSPEDKETTLSPLSLHHHALIFISYLIHHYALIFISHIIHHYALIFISHIIHHYALIFISYLIHHYALIFSSHIIHHHTLIFISHIHHHAPIFDLYLIHHNAPIFNLYLILHLKLSQYTETD
ncbi:hypothetical protein Pcinc_013574 [Petrolisthes cinctipes]|uniref:Uncharacterized protein n=1 Tax=Petrolisthes cinctipes TaxID=88211 RepID=A0AAE1FX67_PETCI|nr:hypothetical protein Pcinc_013574 [Petrolisthes cinctipes]